MSLKLEKKDRWIYYRGTKEEMKAIPELELLGYDRFNKAEEINLHTHENAYEFVFLVQGEANWEVNEQIYHTMANQVFHTKPGQQHRASFNFIAPCTIWWIIIQDPKSSEQWLQLTKDEQEQFTLFLEQLPTVIPANRLLGETFGHLQQLIDQSHIPLYAYQIRHQIISLLLQFMHARPVDQQAVQMKQFAAALAEHIKRNPALRYTTADLAKQNNLSESHFYRAFRMYNGQSPAVYMERTRMDLARQLLLQTTTPITTLAFDLGFKTSQHFATIFKKYVGVTPSEWREAKGNI
ncbi:helix-turn-helix domain-containing protein [Paenibacillus yanchengensis]|uniref:Helix-turn-helix domain-containing protein n=1 Tax=Paenibacillus yanchengensis TaxID=2035833 RepID=A0ABW4YP08_9BACL